MVKVCSGMAMTKEEITGLSETLTMMDLIIITMISMEVHQETSLEAIMIISRKEVERMS